MSCSVCGYSPCSCNTPVGCAPCECPDPGSLTALRHVTGFDYALCEKRLTNAAGILVNQLTGSGQGNVRWSSSPCYLPDEFELSLGETFNGIIANMGDLGCQRRLVPAEDGWLRADGGLWVLSELPDTTVPDPLTLQNLSVQVAATIRNLTVTEQICASATPTGTIDALVGLDATGCIVRQASGGGSATPLTISIASFYESPTETVVVGSNQTTTNGQFAQIGNELFDNDNIAQVVNTTTVKATTAGKYLIIWMGNFIGPGGANFAQCNLNLTVNGSAVALGNGPVTSYQPSTTRSSGVVGSHVRSVAANDTFQLQLSVTGTGGPQSGLQGAKIILVKFAS